MNYHLIPFRRTFCYQIQAGFLITWINDDMKMWGEEIRDLDFTIDIFINSTPSSYLTINIESTEFNEDSIHFTLSYEIKENPKIIDFIEEMKMDIKNKKDTEIKRI